MNGNGWFRITYNIHVIMRSKGNVRPRTNTQYILRVRPTYQRQGSIDKSLYCMCCSIIRCITHNMHIIMYLYNSDLPHHPLYGLAKKTSYLGWWLLQLTMYLASRSFIEQVLNISLLSDTTVRMHWKRFCTHVFLCCVALRISSAIY